VKINDLRADFSAVTADHSVFHSVCEDVDCRSAQHVSACQRGPSPLLLLLLLMMMMMMMTTAFPRLSIEPIASTHVPLPMLR